MDKQLRDAIAEASAHLGVDYRPEAPPTPDDTERGRRGVVPLVGAVAITVLVVFGLPTPSSDPLPAPVVEEDLRWAVARVVLEVERFRTVHRRLPESGDLAVLLGDALEYQSFQGIYIVAGERGGVEVEYDGSVPLEEWRALRVHAADGPR